MNLDQIVANVTKEHLQEVKRQIEVMASVEISHSKFTMIAFN